MLNTIVKIIGAFLCGITITYTTNNILIDNEYKKRKKLLIIAISISILTYFLYDTNYTIESSMFRVILCIILFKITFNKGTYKTIVSALISMGLLSVCDLFISVLFISFVTIDEVRSIWYWILICNFLVSSLTIVISSIKKVKRKLNKFVSNINENDKKTTIFILIITTIVAAYIFYNISINYKWSPKYYINVLIGITYLIIFIIFLKEKNEYYNLTQQYDTLFEYFKEFEESIDNIYFINHEYKNQIAVLKGYIENSSKKEAMNYIENIINDIKFDDKVIISQLKNIPKGGIKGLIYYKIITAKNKKIEITLDISKNVKKALNKLNYEQNKILSEIIGVYIDNAIDETIKLKEKNITIEIYKIDKNITIVISNPLKLENIDLNKINKLGYTTKGIGHGKGLYLARKLIKKVDYIENTTKIINKFFIQELVIKTNLIK